MCGGVIYPHEGKLEKVYFPNPYAKLPVLTKDGNLILLPWGRRAQQTGVLPLGGWARHESIMRGIWEKWFPIPVKIPVEQFMEKDFEGEAQWFPLIKGQVIQGLIARSGEEQRVYVVTVLPDSPEAIHERWPRIVNSI